MILSPEELQMIKERDAAVSHPIDSRGWTHPLNVAERDRHVLLAYVDHLLAQRDLMSDILASLAGG